MYTLLQIIINLNLLDSTNITLLKHFDNINDCQKKIEQTYERYEKANFFVKKLIDDDNEIYLKISEPDKKEYTYWQCKKALF